MARVWAGDMQVNDFIQNLVSPVHHRPRLLSQSRRARRASRGTAGMAITGIVRRSCSIQIDAEQVPGEWSVLGWGGVYSVSWCESSDCWSAKSYWVF